MSTEIYIAARDANNRIVVLHAEKSHLTDLPGALCLIDDEAHALGLHAVGIRFSRPHDGVPYRKVEVLGASPSSLVERLANATRLPLDATTVDAIDPALLKHPPADASAALRRQVNEAFTTYARGEQPTYEPTTPPASAQPSAEDQQQAQALRAQEALMQRCLTEQDRAILRARYGLNDGIIRSNAEVGALAGISAERVRQKVRVALIRLEAATGT